MAPSALVGIRECYLIPGIIAERSMFNDQMDLNVCMCVLFVESRKSIITFSKHHNLMLCGLADEVRGRDVGFIGI